jgi:hypothetical protein
MATKKKARSAPARRARPKAAARQPLWGLMRDLGALRVTLILGALAVMALAPAAGTPPVYAGWSLVPTLIAPTLAPMLFMVLMLDALMGRIMLGSAQGAERARYRRVVTVNLVLGIALALWWTPYFLAVMRPG